MLPKNHRRITSTSDGVTIIKFPKSVDENRFPFRFDSPEPELELREKERFAWLGSPSFKVINSFNTATWIILDWKCMNSSELARRIDELQPDATPLEIARLVLLIQNAVDDIDELEIEERLLTVWREINWRLEAATDQHAAMTDELENLAKSDPQEFSPDQIWILIRAIKVQSQILRLYVGDQCCEVD